ncbi:MAG: hypothetical protein ACTMUB_08555 [cyanobacterium endosymbiont of Rhopalodia musculus]|uniref:hypothetical protein n=1 Tax=cyanobacterium endosymbiont of Epithemia clementina EcSB TaxID=3034674 RepID=UPI002480A0F4|nr:hypothetical protein [cyanobacterium endosymbiont of Epithemia clementina EcSB]WGT68122.1 hypothetical protein P3F56_03345 [cyanobacterium endosymbiont of Epithemia clementina EcSB]
MSSDFDEKLKTMTEDLTSVEEPCLALKIESAKETQARASLSSSKTLVCSPVFLKLAR